MLARGGGGGASQAVIMTIYDATSDNKATTMTTSSPQWELFKIFQDILNEFEVIYICSIMHTLNMASRAQFLSTMGPKPVPQF